MKNDNTVCAGVKAPAKIKKPTRKGNKNAKGK